MTSTQIVTSQSIGTSTNKGSDLFAVRLTPQSITDRFFVEIRQTNGAGEYDPGNALRCWYACYNASITASGAPAILRRTARFVDMKPSKFGSVVVSITSLLEPLSGPYLYVWFDVPAFVVAASLDAWVHEGP